MTSFPQLPLRGYTHTHTHRSVLSDCARWLLLLLRELSEVLLLCAVPDASRATCAPGLDLKIHRNNYKRHPCLKILIGLAPRTQTFIAGIIVCFNHEDVKGLKAGKKKKELHNGKHQHSVIKQPLFATFRHR